MVVNKINVYAQFNFLLLHALYESCKNIKKFTDSNLYQQFRQSFIAMNNADVNCSNTLGPTVVCKLCKILTTETRVNVLFSFCNIAPCITKLIHWKYTVALWHVDVYRNVTWIHKASFFYSKKQKRPTTLLALSSLIFILTNVYWWLQL